MTGTPAQFTRKTLVLTVEVSAVVTLLVGLAVLIRLRPELGAETAFMEWVRGWNAPGLTLLMDKVSDFSGNPGVILAPAVTLALFIAGRRRAAIAFLMTVSVVAFAVYAADKGLGEISDRGRPLPYVTESSYPSGHTSGATWFYGFLIYLTYWVGLPRAVRVVVAAIPAILIALVGLSRIYLHLHWPLDVIGGYALGALGALFAIWLFLALGAELNRMLDDGWSRPLTRPPRDDVGRTQDPATRGVAGCGQT